MNGHPLSTASQPAATAGWAAFDAYDGKRRGGLAFDSNASWLADFVPSSYRQGSLPVYHGDGRSLSPLKRIRKILLRNFPFLEPILLPRQRSLTRPTANDPWAGLPSGDAVRFVLLCALWYTSSALSSNTGKAIMNQFRYPVTLTFVQFGFVALYCLLFMSPFIQFSKLRSPTKAILKSTFPMGCFQVGGHIFSSMAISRIPVSTVHTIKALSPLFTVAAYALLFGVSYSAQTYISLLPLTVGVMLACSFDMSASNAIGLLCAFGSALVFVSSNIFFKKIMPTNNAGGSNGTSHKLDKLNLLFYSSSMAFILMIPIWVYTDLPILLASTPGNVAHPSHPGPVHTSLTYYFFTNGTVHFLQNVLAFVLLARTSPVTYSIASLLKRVAVICAAFLWFSQRVHPVQAVGILMTFVGLYMYNKAVKKGDVDRGERKARRVERAWEGGLPQTKNEVESDTERTAFVQVEPVQMQAYSRPNAHAHAHPHIHGFSQSRPHPNLHIDTTPQPLSHYEHSKKGDDKGPAGSPTNSYPSPPPSLDSPPSHSPVSASRGPWPTKRRGTINGLGHMPEFRQEGPFLEGPRTGIIAA